MRIKFAIIEFCFTVNFFKRRCTIWTRYVPTVPIVDMGKEGQTLISPWSFLIRKLSFIELPWELLALCQFSVVKAIDNAISWPDKLETSLMAHGGSNGNRSEKREGEVESRKWASDSFWVWRTSGLTRDGTAEPNSRDQALRREWGQGKFRFSCSADHKQDWQPYPVDAQSAESDDHTHTHKHTHTRKTVFSSVSTCYNPYSCPAA